MTAREEFPALRAVANLRLCRQPEEGITHLREQRAANNYESLCGLNAAREGWEHDTVWEGAATVVRADCASCVHAAAEMSGAALLEADTLVGEMGDVEMRYAVLERLSRSLPSDTRLEFVARRLQATERMLEVVAYDPHVPEGNAGIAMTVSARLSALADELRPYRALRLVKP